MDNEDRRLPAAPGLRGRVLRAVVGVDGELPAHRDANLRQAALGLAVRAEERDALGEARAHGREVRWDDEHVLVDEADDDLTQKQELKKS